MRVIYNPEKRSIASIFAIKEERISRSKASTHREHENGPTYSGPRPQGSKMELFRKRNATVHFLLEREQSPSQYCTPSRSGFGTNRLRHHTGYGGIDGSGRARSATRVAARLRVQRICARRIHQQICDLRLGAPQNVFSCVIMKAWCHSRGLISVNMIDHSPMRT